MSDGARHIVTGAAYVAQISARQSDRRARFAFQQLVFRIVQPGGALFDFGAGPGIDARFYAESGYTAVEGYCSLTLPLTPDFRGS